ncbi:MAG: hypothetical protein Q8P20_04590 [bacterium]|nr:hypothetical protein [bacterium]
MSLTTIELKVKDDIVALVEIVLAAAMGFCKYDLSKRQAYLDNHVMYVSIQLWNGNVITATPIDSPIEHGVTEYKDFVLMDGPSISGAIEADLKCLLRGIKQRFVTHTDIVNSKDMLLWQITKPS